MRGRRDHAVAVGETCQVGQAVGRGALPVVTGSHVVRMGSAAPSPKHSGVKGGRPPSPGQAFAEYGRIAGTEHVLRVVDRVGGTCRRR